MSHVAESHMIQSLLVYSQLVIGMAMLLDAFHGRQPVYLFTAIRLVSSNECNVNRALKDLEISLYRR
jgi:hypothetical protein